jgi:hypothetical protein
MTYPCWDDALVGYWLLVIGYFDRTLDIISPMMLRACAPIKLVPSI